MSDDEMYCEPTPEGMVGPEHVERALDIVILKDAARVLEQHGLSSTAWLVRRAHRRVAARPLTVPFPKERLTPEDSNSDDD